MENSELIEEQEDSVQQNAEILLYTLEILRKYSSEENRLTPIDIITRIKNDYNLDTRQKLIMKDIEILIDHGFDIKSNIEAGEGYYLNKKELSSDDVFMVWEGLMASKYTSEADSGEILKKLGKFSVVDYTINNQIAGGLTNKAIPERDILYDNLKTIVKALNSDKRLLFMENKRDYNYNLVPVSEEKTIYNIYALVNIDNEYYLAASKVGYNEMRCFKVADLSDVEQVEENNAKLKLIQGYEKGFDINKFASQFIEGYGGDVTDFIVKIKTDKVGEAVEIFGNVRLIEENEDSLTLDIVANADKVFMWAFKSSEYVEVLEPAAMRFRLKEYFDKMSWMYR